MTAKKTTKSMFREIELSLIDRPEEILRLEIDQGKLSELANSIKAKGLLQPIGVTPRGARYMIVFGDRRYLAHRLLDKKKIMCRVEEIEDKEVAIDRAIENLQSVDLTPFEEAHLYISLIEKAGMTLEEISERVGKSAGTVQRRIDIMRMPESFQKALHQKTINVAVAEELWHCPDKSRREYFVELAIEHGITRKVAHDWVMEYKKAKRVQEKDVEGGGGEPTPYKDEKLYRACDLCQGPEEYKNLRFLRICKICSEKLNKAVETVI